MAGMFCLLYRNFIATCDIAGKTNFEKSEA